MRLVLTSRDDESNALAGGYHCGGALRSVKARVADFVIEKNSALRGVVLYGWTMDCFEKCGIIRKRIVACSLLLFLCSCGHSSSDPCESSAYEECKRRTENTIVSDVVCDRYAVNACEE